MGLSGAAGAAMPMGQMITGEENKTAEGVANQVQCRKGPAQQNGEEFAVVEPQQLYEVKVLSDLDQGCKDKYIARQSPEALRKENPDKAADQHRDQHIAHIGSDEIVMDEQRDQDLCQ